MLTNVQFEVIHRPIHTIVDTLEEEEIGGCQEIWVEDSCTTSIISPDMWYDRAAKKAFYRYRVSWYRLLWYRLLWYRVLWYRGTTEVSFLMVSVFYDQVKAKCLFNLRQGKENFIEYWLKKNSHCRWWKISTNTLKQAVAGMQLCWDVDNATIYWGVDSGGVRYTSDKESGGSNLLLAGVSRIEEESC